MLDETEFVRENENISILFKSKKIDNVYKGTELKLFTEKNKKYVNEFNDYMKKKAIKEYEKTAVSFVEEQIGGDIENPEFINNIVDDCVLEIKNKIDNIIHEYDLKEFLDNIQDPRRTLFERYELREFRGLVYFENIYPNLSECEEKLKDWIKTINIGEKRL